MFLELSQNHTQKRRRSRGASPREGTDQYADFIRKNLSAMALLLSKLDKTNTNASR